MKSEKTYKLEKSIWSENDFDKMGWHDSRIYGFAFIEENEDSQTDLYLDIDYIFEWIIPKPPDKNFNFQVAPCTLVFHNIIDMVIDIETGRLYQTELEIDDLKMEYADHNESMIWTIETHSGHIKFEATGFTQYVRKLPKRIDSQQLTIDERGGIKFDKTELKI